MSPTSQAGGFPRPRRSTRTRPDCATARQPNRSSRGASITVTEVRVSPDLMQATAFVAPLGGGDVDKIVSALHRAAPYLRGQVVKAVKLRRAPNLGFVPDTSFDYASRIDAALRQPTVRRDTDGEDA